MWRAKYPNKTRLALARKQRYASFSATKSPAIRCVTLSLTAFDVMSKRLDFIPLLHYTIPSHTQVLSTSVITLTPTSIGGNLTC